MTTQIPDTCTIAGRRWAIAEWEGSRDCIPRSESLGFTTKTESTTNWCGRTDHFLVHRNRLYLLKIQANLEDSCADVRPDRARLETVIRDERRFVRKQTLFVYDDLTIPFNGAMFISRPHEDDWNTPQSAPADLGDGETRKTLLFARGYLVSAIQHWPEFSDLEFEVAKAEEALTTELLGLMPNDGPVLSLWNWDIRFEDESFEDIVELAFSGDTGYVSAETAKLAEDFQRWIEEWGLDFNQDQSDDNAFRAWALDVCNDFVQTWRKNVATSFGDRLATF